MKMITNEEKYKTSKERIKAFSKFCNMQNRDCYGCPVAKSNDLASCALCWLKLKAEEKGKNKNDY